MAAALLMFDVAGLVLVAVWLGRGNGGAGLFAWRSRPPEAAPEANRRARETTRRAREANRRTRARGRQA